MSASGGTMTGWYELSGKIFSNLKQSELKNDDSVKKYVDDSSIKGQKYVDDQIKPFIRFRRRVTSILVNVLGKFPRAEFMIKNTNTFIICALNILSNVWKEYVANDVKIKIAKPLASPEMPGVVGFVFADYYRNWKARAEDAIHCCIWGLLGPVIFTVSAQRKYLLLTGIIIMYTVVTWLHIFHFLEVVNRQDRTWIYIIQNLPI